MGWSEWIDRAPARMSISGTANRKVTSGLSNIGSVVIPGDVVDPGAPDEARDGCTNWGSGFPQFGTDTGLAVTSWFVQGVYPAGSPPGDQTGYGTQLGQTTIVWDATSRLADRDLFPIEFADLLDAHPEWVEGVDYEFDEETGEYVLEYESGDATVVEGGDIFYSLDAAADTGYIGTWDAEDGDPPGALDSWFYLHTGTSEDMSGAADYYVDLAITADPNAVPVVNVAYSGTFGTVGDFRGATSESFTKTDLVSDLSPFVESGDKIVMHIVNYYVLHGMPDLGETNNFIYNWVLGFSSVSLFLMIQYPRFRYWIPAGGVLKVWTGTEWRWIGCEDFHPEDGRLKLWDGSEWWMERVTADGAVEGRPLKIWTGSEWRVAACMIPST